jgi:hypothetical protein
MLFLSPSEGRCRPHAETLSPKALPPPPGRAIVSLCWATPKQSVCVRGTAESRQLGAAAEGRHFLHDINNPHLNP